MDEDSRSREELVSELRALRQRVATLESERLATSSVLQGDPNRQRPPLLEQIPAVVWCADRDLRLTWWTGGARQSILVDPDSLVGIDLYEFLGTEDDTHPAVDANRRALGGESVSYTSTVGDDVTFHAHVEPLHDAGGEIVGVIGVGVDITEREQLIGELREALSRVRTLSGLIPICMHCKNVRDDHGFWQNVENYVRDHSDAEFSHGICPECMERVLPATGTDER